VRAAAALKFTIVGQTTKARLLQAVQIPYRRSNANRQFPAPVEGTIGFETIDSPSAKAFPFRAPIEY
jgi:hypothetical protein